MFFVEFPLAAGSGDGLGERVEFVGGHFVHVFVVGARQRMDFELAMAVLAAAAGLADILPFGFRFLANRFAIRDLRTAHVGFHVEFALHAVNDDFEMQLAHAGNERLPGLRVGVHAEGGIFLRKARERLAHFVLIRLGLGFDGDGNNRSGKIDGFEDDLLLFVAKRVAGGDVFQTDAGADVAGVYDVNFFALVGVHLEKAADAFARLFGRVVNIAAGFQDAGIDADIGHVADKRVGHDFERKRGKRLIVGRTPQNRVVILGIDAFDGGNIHGRREIIDDGVEQWLNALVLERGASQHRNDFHRQSRFADGLPHLFDGERFAVQVFVHQLVVVLGDVLDHFAAVVFVKLFVDGGALQRRRYVGTRIDKIRIPQLLDFKDFEFGAQSFFEPYNHFLFEKIDASDEVVFSAEGKLEGNGVGSEALAHGADGVVKVSAHLVHLIDERETRNAILVRLAPHGFRLRLHAGNGIKNRDGSVKNAQRTLHFHRKVHVAGRINNIDAVFLAGAVPGSASRGAGDGDAALALLLHPVHGGRALVHRTDLVGHTRVIKDPLGRGGLAGVDVRHDPDIPGVFEFERSSHSPSSLFVSGPDCNCFAHDLTNSLSLNLSYQR